LSLPHHIAIVMDGNGRWAAARGEPRPVGHRAGIEPVRKVIRECARLNIEALTLFAFSSENWRRPETEVAAIMGLFMEALDREVAELHANRVRVRIIGNRQRLSVRLQRRIAEAEALTADNDGLKLQVAVSYGGRWDEDLFSAELQLSDLPDPDLFIRTGGDHRVSNFLLWNIAYAELYFTDVLWPDFNEAEFQLALDDFAQRERRFGLTGPKK
jgi:undecaprenyl diphosphate synthase